MEYILKGECTGGLSCNGGCCKSNTYEDGCLTSEGFCKHYNEGTGMCNIYDIREEMGYGGCITFPILTQTLISQGLPPGCGYSIEEVN